MVTYSEPDPRLARQLLEKLDGARTLDESGNVVFKGIGFDTPWSLLSDLLTFDSAVPAFERSRIARKAISAAAGRGALTLPTFLKQASRLEREYLLLPKKRFVLLTQISLSRLDVLPNMRLGDLAISFPSDVPSAFLRSRSKAMETMNGLHAAPPENYRWVRVSTHQRCSAAVMAATDDCLQLLLGLWNLCLNRRTGWRWSSGPRQPVNEIGLGPVHTVHKPSGAADDLAGWYEPDYVAPFRVKRLGNKTMPMLQDARTMRRKLEHITFRDHVEECIRSYNHALDERDFAKSFILLWQALEMSTNTEKGDGHTITVRRASSPYGTNHDYHAAILGHLRDVRNRLVHTGSDSEDMESKLYRLKGYVEILLLFHIFSGRQFASREEVTEFLDLPYSASELSRRLALMRRAMRMRRRKPA
jgi:hypothetical protein